MGGSTVEPVQLTPWPDVEAVIRLLIAAMAGALVGFERERAGKPAGLRDMALIALRFPHRA